MDDNPQNIFAKASFILLNGKQIPEQQTRDIAIHAYISCVRKREGKNPLLSFSWACFFPTGIQFL